MDPSAQKAYLSKVINQMNGELDRAQKERKIGRPIGRLVKIERMMGKLRVKTTEGTEVFDAGLAENLSQAQPGDQLSVFGEAMGCETVLVGSFEEQFDQARRGATALWRIYMKL